MAIETYKDFVEQVQNFVPYEMLLEIESYIYLLECQAYWEGYLDGEAGLK